jgi:hypothetical protein
MLAAVPPRLGFLFERTQIVAHALPAEGKTRQEHLLRDHPCKKSAILHPRGQGDKQCGRSRGNPILLTCWLERGFGGSAKGGV